MNFLTPKLPRISRISLVGYFPIFSKNIDTNVSNNRLLVLGGNGLGKTTILQSIIYCIAGESDLEVESIKNKRWGRSYFEGRISDLKNAFISVDFYLGEDKINLKRGFKSHAILEFSLNDQLVRSQTSLEQEFENYLREYAGYQSLVDFRFILHKLCYLPEDRSNLVWDSEIQLRLMMLLFADLINETEFNEKRKQLKLIDSKKRHINVALNAARKELQEASNRLATKVDHPKDLTLPPPPNTISGLSVEMVPEKSDDSENGLQILREIAGLNLEKVNIQNYIKQLKKELSDITVVIEELQSKLLDNEENFILEQLRRYEDEEVKLGLHKLIHRQICPVCGEKADDLAQLAVKHIQEEKCPLCGSDQGGAILDKDIFPLLDAQISEKIHQKFTTEKVLINNEKALLSILDKEEDLQFRFNKLRIENLSNEDQMEETEGDDIIELDLKKDTNEATGINQNIDNILQLMQNKVDNLEHDFYELDNSFMILKNELERKYANFTKIALERTLRLGELYERYATAFLGLPCQLETKVSDVKFLTLNLYVPKFDGKIREKPETCSEAQRFFLDIAFRMATIDLAKELSQSTGSFICETPENALDVTYINNVATMFKNFAKEGNTLIATGNLQPAGLAGHILYDIPKEQRQMSILNLLEYGRLSVVQNENISALQGVLLEVIDFGGG